MTKVFGSYTGRFDLGGDARDIIPDGTIITFDDICYETKYYYITVTLTGVYPSITSDVIEVVIHPNIGATYNDSLDGYSESTAPVEATKNQDDELSVVGSKLDVVFGTSEVKINRADDDTVLTINAKGISSVEFRLTDNSGNSLTSAEDGYKYFVDESNKLQTSMTLNNTGNNTGYLNFVHSATDINARLEITIKHEVEGTTYTYEKTYMLYITIPESYELSSVYRVEGSEFETVVNGTILSLKNDGNQSIETHFFGDAEQTYIKANTFDSNKTYYEFNGTTYTKVETPKDEDFDKYYETISEVNNIVNDTRVAIKVNDKYYYGFSNFDALGLFDANNPNKLRYSVTRNGENNQSRFDTDTLTLSNLDNGYETIFNIVNSTNVSLSYVFKVYNEENDYNHIEYNGNLLQIDNNPDDGKVNLDYISIPYSEFESGVSIDLAYLEYEPSDSQIAQVIMIDKSTNNQTDVLNYKIIRDISSSTYISKLVISNNKLTSSTVYEIDFIIITVNGIASRITLVIADFKADYGYYLAGQSYETVYGGTQIGKLTDKYDAKYDRLTVTVAEKKNYALEYVKPVNGHITKWALGQELPETKVVRYDNNNGISLLNVKETDGVPATLVFNVVYGDNNAVVGRVFYQLMIKNNLKIGVNPILKDSNLINLYLGSEIYTIKYQKIATQAEYDIISLSQIYTYEEGTGYIKVTDTTKPKFETDKYYYPTTIIDLLQSQQAVEITEEEWSGISTVYICNSEGVYEEVAPKPGTYAPNYYKLNYNNLFVTLEQYSTGNTIAEGKALYNGSKSALSTNVVEDYLRFEIAEERL